MTRNEIIFDDLALIDESIIITTLLRGSSAPSDRVMHDALFTSKHFARLLPSACSVVVSFRVVGVGPRLASVSVPFKACYNEPASAHTRTLKCSACCGICDVVNVLDAGRTRRRRRETRRRRRAHNEANIICTLLLPPSACASICTSPITMN